MSSRRNSAAPAAMPFGPPPPPPMAFSPLYRQPALPYYPRPRAPLQMPPYPAQTTFLPAPFQPPPPHVGVPFLPPVPGHPPMHPAPYNFAPAAPPMPPPQLRLRSVTSANLDAEMQLIGNLMLQYPCITIDVEYAGVVHHPDPGSSTPDERYAVVKSNVDEVPVVQLGITLSDAQGNLPFRFFEHGQPPHEIAWEVVFSDFDASRDPRAIGSVEFLENQGVDLELARQIGVSSTAFGEMLLAILPPRRDELTWSAFGGAYDMAYLVKMLTGGQPLPDTRQQFLEHMRSWLGAGRIFDAKYIVEQDRQDLHGAGLRHTADSLGVRQQPGMRMLAGHKSVLACGIFAAIRTRGVGLLHEGVIDGL